MTSIAKRTIAAWRSWHTRSRYARRGPREHSSTTRHDVFDHDDNRDQDTRHHHDEAVRAADGSTWQAESDQSDVSRRRATAKMNLSTSIVRPATHRAHQRRATYRFAITEHDRALEALTLLGEPPLKPARSPPSHDDALVRVLRRPSRLVGASVSSFSISKARRDRDVRRALRRDALAE